MTNDEIVRQLADALRRTSETPVSVPFRSVADRPLDIQAIFREQAHKPG